MTILTINKFNRFVLIVFVADVTYRFILRLRLKNILNGTS